MKNSEIFRKAQECVIAVPFLKFEEKRAILRELFAQEDLALFCEKQEEEKVEEA